MVYTPNPTWANTSAGGTPITAAALQHIEDGIAALGTYTSYTPTLTNISVGTTGSVTGSWTQIGKTVVGRISISLGGTGISFAAQAAVGLPSGLPVIGNTNARVQYFDFSAVAFYPVMPYRDVATTPARTLLLGYPGTNGLHVDATASLPFIWASGDQISITFMFITS